MKTIKDTSNQKFPITPEDTFDMYFDGNIQDGTVLVEKSFADGPHGEHIMVSSSEGSLHKMRIVNLKQEQYYDTNLLKEGVEYEVISHPITEEFIDKLNQAKHI